MKKLMAGFLTGIIIGWLFGAIDWKKGCDPFSTGTWGIASPAIEPHISHFETKSPPFSSDHFLFYDGGPDVDEYWSFVLPPEYARVFLDTYVKKNSLSAVSPDTKLPDWITRSTDHKDWRADLWFRSTAELSEAYYKKGLFCGYSAEKNRIYLMNWTE
jgi:hypothetical protein